MKSWYVLAEVGHWGWYSTKHCTKISAHPHPMYIECNTTDMKEV